MLALKQGNDYTITYNILNENGSVKDLTGTQLLQYALSEARHKPSIIDFTNVDARLNIADAAAGKVELKLTSEDLKSIAEGTYYHEIRQTNAIGDPSIILSEKLQLTSSLIKE